MEPLPNTGATDPVLATLADDLCVLAYDIENSVDDVDLTLARRARALCNELRTLAKTHSCGRDSGSVNIYVDELIRRGRALLASSDSQPPSAPTSRRTTSGTHQRVLADLVFDDDPATSPGGPHAIHAMAARLLLSI